MRDYDGLINRRSAKAVGMFRVPLLFPGLRRFVSFVWRGRRSGIGVNAAGDSGDTSRNILVGGTSTGISPSPNIITYTFGYSRPILLALRSLSLKPISFGYKTPPIRFSQAGGQSAHKARPPNLELALKPLRCGPPGEANVCKR